jgi:uncharacterized protein (DUF1015 family)
MANIQPFKALRPQPNLAQAMAAPPYDVLNSAEAAAVTSKNPLSFLRVTKSEVDIPGIQDIHCADVYDKAKANLQNWIAEGKLFREEKPCYYIYELTMHGRKQTGIVAASSVDDYEQNVILKHEFTRPEKELDRINHIRTTGAQTGNVFLAYRDVGEINSLVEHWKENHQPVYAFIAEDQIGHAIWVVDDSDTVSRIQHLFKDQVPHTYIADGHHRAASAAKVRQGLPANHHAHANYFLTTLFPAAQLHIMDYNRVVKDLHGLATAEFIKELYQQFDVERMPAAFSPTHLHEFGMYLDGNWYKLVSKPGSYTADPIGILDVTILQQNILDPILGIKDQRTDKRIDFVGGIRGLSALEARVDSGEMAVAFSLHPVSIQQLFDIADSGNVMPPKSTWFEPKLRDGLLTHLIYE